MNSHERITKIEDYVHRIGRTGRAGKSGKAVTCAGRTRASRRSLHSFHVSTSHFIGVLRAVAGKSNMQLCASRLRSAVCTRFFCPNDIEKALADDLVGILKTAKQEVPTVPEREHGGGRNCSPTGHSGIAWRLLAVCQAIRIRSNSDKNGQKSET